MFKSYFTIVLRNLVRSKVYSMINILGLSLGISCCLLLAIYVHDEYSYDKHHKRLEDIYRIDTEFASGRLGFNKLGSVSPPIAMTLKDELPEVEAAARFLSPPTQTQNLIRYEEQLFYESDGFIADSTLFDVLTYEFTEGNPKKALTDANTVVLSQSLAHRIFNSSSALNKSISISQDSELRNYKVTGVYKDNQKSFVHANFITSIMSEGWGEYLRTNPDASREWAGQNFVPSYVKLVHGHSKIIVEKKINDVLIKYGSENMKVLGLQKKLFLEPVKDIYLRSMVDTSQRIVYLYIISSIAMFMLLIGCINFMNLSTAKATKRATEIGIRKVMGAFRGALIRQILGEAMLIVLISILIALAIVQFSLALFNELSGKSISLHSENALYVFVALVVIAVVTGLIAGSYPAFYLSSFEPARVLKGRFNTSISSGRLRQGLVVFQFMIAIVLVCGMIVISRQLKFAQEKDLGFETQSRIIIPLRTDPAKKQYPTLKKAMQSMSSITGVSGVSYAPGSRIFSDMGFYSEGKSMDDAISITRDQVDAGYLELLGIKLLAGRSFSANRETEQGKIIVNRATVLKFGLSTEQIIGQHLYFDWHGKKSEFEVIGVMEDINQTSLKDEIRPTLYQIPEGLQEYQAIVASISIARTEDVVKQLEGIWKTQVENTPFEYTFLDDFVMLQYREDEQVAGIIRSFTMISIIICMLGLYGLSSFMAERRSKEIGIRKVLGANVGQIVFMMSSEFIRLVFIAFVLALPVAWYSMSQWLESFAYRISIDFSVFAYAGIGSLAIALVAVGTESLRAAVGNPVHAIRNE